jgi:hypothetical protein
LQHASGSLKERNIPGQYADGIAEIYNDVRVASNTLSVELAGVFVGVSSSQFTPFDEAEHNIYVEALRGCTSVVVVSRLGAWASHFWEGPSFISGDTKFTADVLDYLRRELGGHASTFAGSATTKAYIMTPAPETLDVNDGTADARAGSYPQKYPDQVGKIVSVLNDILPGVAVNDFVYRVQRNEVALRTGVFGKAMVSRNAG